MTPPYPPPRAGNAFWRRLPVMLSFILILCSHSPYTLGANHMSSMLSSIFKTSNNTPSTMTKFDWYASEGAPKSYPMELAAGNLSFPDHGSQYIPSGATLHHGWGRGRSSHVGGPDLKSLPNRLSLIFFSYTENQFYRGEFELPYDKILALFQAGHYSPKDRKHITYNEITTGIAPGGAVAVWVSSLDRTVEVFFGQAEKSDIEWTAIVDNPDISREEFIRRRMAESFKAESLTPDAIEALQKNGIPFGRWASYRPRYHWQLSVTGFTLSNGRVSEVKYFNGERDYLDVRPRTSPAADPQAAAETRAVPRKMTFVWERAPDVQDRLFKVYFNEAEIFAAFKQLGGQQQPLQLELRIERREDGLSHFVVWLHNATESYHLIKTTFETWGASKLKAEFRDN